MNWLNHLALASGLALTVALPFGTAHAQTAVVKRSTELRESPADNAPSLGAIPANTQVTRTSERNGPWVKVQTPEGASGWVHNLDMGAANSAAPSGNNNASTGSMRTLGGVLGRGGTSTTTPTSTAGTRGWGNGKGAQAPAGAQQSQDGDDDDMGEETPAPTKGQQGARNANTGNVNKASAYQRPPSNNPQAPTAPGLSTYSSGNNNNWGMGNGNNNGGANSWGNNK